MQIWHKKQTNKINLKTKTKTKQNVPRIYVRWKFWGVSGQLFL